MHRISLLDAQLDRSSERMHAARFDPVDSTTLPDAHSHMLQVTHLKSQLMAVRSARELDEASWLREKGALQKHIEHLTDVNINSRALPCCHVGPVIVTYIVCRCLQYA